MADTSKLPKKQLAKVEKIADVVCDIWRKANIPEKDIQRYREKLIHDLQQASNSND